MCYYIIVLCAERSAERIHKEGHIMKLISVIFMNLWGYDILIFIAALFTAVVYRRLKYSADKLYKKMHLTVFVPDGGASRREADRDISGLREQDIVAMRNNTGKLYSLFVNLTGIFPLLGILGTVISLLSLVSDSTNVTGNFYGALTSTFWGLVFAIIFKFLDGIVSAKIEDNEKSVELYLTRNFRTVQEDIPAEPKLAPRKVNTIKEKPAVMEEYKNTVSPKKVLKSMGDLFGVTDDDDDIPEYKEETVKSGSSKKGVALVSELFGISEGDDDEEK